MVTKGTGARKHARMNIDRPGFLVLEPDGPWVECLLLMFRRPGADLKVGALVLPDTLLLLLTPDGKVRRACKLVWRKCDLAGVRFCLLENDQTSRIQVCFCGARRFLDTPMFQSERINPGGFCWHRH